MMNDDEQTLDTYWAKFKDYIKPKSSFQIADIRRNPNNRRRCQNCLHRGGDKKAGG